MILGMYKIDIYWHKFWYEVDSKITILISLITILISWITIVITILQHKPTFTIKSYHYFKGVVDRIDQKLFRLFIHDQRSTAILRWWICIDSRYQPYSLVDESSSTVDIDRDRSTGR